MALAVCPIPNFADEFCGALVLWRLATASYCDALAEFATPQLFFFKSNNSATSPLIKILKSAFFSQRLN
jgi:hypothetical protein